MSRRFLYRANALALGGRLFKPAPAVIESQTSAVLPVSGGVGRADSGSFRYGDLLAYDHASVYVLGNDSSDEGPYSAETYVRIEGLNILGRVRIRTLVGRLTSSHVRALDSASTSLKNTVDPSGSLIEGLTVDGSEVSLVSHVGLLSGFPDYGSLVSAYRSSGQPFTDVANSDFFWNGGALQPGAPRALAEVAEQCALHRAANRGSVQAPALSHGLLPCRLFGTSRVPSGVAAQSFPGALVVQGIGVLHFGEYLIGPDSRRLTMLRIELNTAQVVAQGPRGGSRGRMQALRADGSGGGRSGDINVGNIETNGHPWP
jgi:hypothetical protein